MASVLEGSGLEGAKATRRGPLRLLRWGLYSALVAGLGLVWHLEVGTGRLWGSPGPTVNLPMVTRPPGGSLLIGGGKISEEIRDHFVALAGGRSARIVIIPTASGLAESAVIVEPWKRYGLASVTRLHAKTREEAEKPGFSDALDDATGVWFSGGFQQRLASRYLDTEVERRLHDVLDRGGVIGGSSAGAAVMTRVMIAGGREEARLDRGFDLLPDAVVDQHFLKRNRLGRLLGVMKQHPKLLGIGVDEKTALVVDVRARRARVVGESYVVACVPETATDPSRVRFLKPGDEADLTALRTRPETAVAPAIDFDAL